MDIRRQATVLLMPLLLLGGAGEPRYAARELDAASATVWAGSIADTSDYKVFKEFLTGTIRYAYAKTMGPEDYYNIVGGSLTWSAAGGDGDCVYSGGPAQITLSSNNTSGDMIVRSDGRYTANTILIASPGIITVVCKGGASFSFDGQAQGILLVPFLSPYYYLTDGGKTMTGSYLFADLTTYSWLLTADPPELEVEPVGYDQWRPEAGPSEQDPGNDLVIQARLLKPDGSPSDRPADHFRFELIEASREPGIAMNYPLAGQATDAFDLAFREDRNPDAETRDASGQWIQMPSAFESQATLTSHDWGGWGTLKVTAVVDGAPLVGYMKGDRSETQVRIPKRVVESKIADAWKSGNSATSLADESDLDYEPDGDGHDGDGFTVYEEYRGFIEKGRHISTDPFTKDLFVRDKIGGLSKVGIRLFIDATRLDVHHELEASEFPGSRVMNTNRRDGPHLDNQHGLIITRGSEEYISTAVSATGEPGLPRSISRIEISRFSRYGPIELQQLRSGQGTRVVSVWDHVYAHEMGHAVNIWHHGDIDVVTRWAVLRDGSGRIVRDTSAVPVVVEEGTGEILVYREPANRVVPLFLQGSAGPQDMWVGYGGGQHSGDEECMMRYRVANAYVTTGVVRFLALEGPRGTPGTSLPPHRFCSSSIGTGINAPERQPQPQFGNASSNGAPGPSRRGNCEHRICVNDRYPDH